MPVSLLCIHSPSPGASCWNVERGHKWICELPGCLAAWVGGWVGGWERRH